jgi:FlaA1/EpsC-like NDP-sugar epimerase
VKVRIGHRSSRVTLLTRRRPLILASQAVLVVLSYYCAFLLRFDFRPGQMDQRSFLLTLPLVLTIKLLLFQRFGLLRGWWRYVGMSDAVDIVKAALASTAVLYPLLILAIRVPGYPWSALAIDLALTVLLVGGARFAVRAYTETARQWANQKHTLIVGAGRAGSSIVRELNRNPQLELKPVGFVDDDSSKRGIRIDGIKVLGPVQEMSDLIARLGVECVLIAIPSATGAQVERIVSECRACKVDFKILPPMRQHIHGQKVSMKSVRSLRLDDLLQREPVHIDLAGIRREVEGKVLLITGAGGSIGSELARQIATFAPRELLLVDRSENCLFALGLELARTTPTQKFSPLVADIQDVGAMREIFASHRPEVVFHAAAYKHVPMMERNCFQAVMNNVFGTYNAALLARQFGAETFVMISSDKAVNPTNVMGVTKRVAELIMLGLQDERTRFVAVRFGNVLGSNGSVIPIFQQQIAEGGPVTVTHPDAKRYFMTIPEAVQLVLQASAMGRGSEIFVLDMGKPIRILDLARDLIRLSGLEPEEDVKIVFTGLRPGEKLFEELMLEGEGVKPTWHPKIRVLDGGRVNFRQVCEWLDELQSTVESKNVSGLIDVLRRIVPEYTPSEEIRAMCEVDRHDVTLLYRRARASLWHPASEAA